MTPETNITFIVNAYWMVGITTGLFFGLLALVWKGKAEINSAIIDALKPFRDDMRSLGDRVSGHDEKIGELAGKYGSASSPMKPNPSGERLLKESGFNDIYSANKNRIFGLMDEIGTRTLYDAEKNARLALKKLESDPMMDPVKEYAVNHPFE